MKLKVPGSHSLSLFLQKGGKRTPPIMALPTIVGRQFSCSTIRAQFAEGEKDNRLRFPGALEAKFTTHLRFESNKDRAVIPCYRVMDTEGVIVDPSYEFDLSDEEALKLYTNMLAVSIMDSICLDAQRQGWLIA